MPLSDLTVRDFDSEVHNFTEHVVNPCLVSSIKYDRLTGDFSSTVYNLLLPGLKPFVLAGGKMRLVCSVNLSVQDVKTMLDNIEKGEELLENELKSELARYMDLLDQQKIGDAGRKLLGALIEWDILEIKIGVTKTGQFHKKIGVFEDEDQNRVTFQGSRNATFMGMYGEQPEDCDVFEEWHEYDHDRIDKHVRHFSNAWLGKTSHMTTYDLPTAVQQELIQYRSHETVGQLFEDPEIENLIQQAIKIKTPSFPKKPNPKDIDSLWRHQKKAIEAWQVKKRGLLQHATGSGKTFTALHIIHTWLEKGNPVLVIVPGTTLRRQWRKLFRDFFPDTDILEITNSEVARNRLPRFAVGPRIILCNIQVARKPEFIARMKLRIKSLLMVVDEAHRSGASSWSKIFEIPAHGRLGLSATPVRGYDEEGTDKILSYFEGIVDTYSLADAISDGHLVQYEYHVKPAFLDNEEQEKWDRLTRDIGRLAAKQLSPKEARWLNTKIIQRASIIKSCKQKVPVATAVLQEEYAEDLGKWLVYCNWTPQLEELEDSLKKIVSRPDLVKAYHGGIEDSQRERNLNHFASRGGILIAMKMLDEGIDIPSLDNALILASSQSSIEHIQRLGRVLRRDRSGSKSKAQVIDLLVLPNATPGEGQNTGYIKTELERAMEFSETAINRIRVQKQLSDIANQYGIALSSSNKDSEDLDD